MFSLCGSLCGANVIRLWTAEWVFWNVILSKSFKVLTLTTQFRCSVVGYKAAEWRGRGGIMPKKAKKGGGKGGGKTEEERLLYLQQKAQAEEEMARQKEEILTQFLKVTQVETCISRWADRWRAQLSSHRLVFRSDSADSLLRFNSSLIFK